MKNRIKKGFTLAELLVVVGIIAILVAIAIPTFSSATKKADAAVELANARSAYAEGMLAVISGEAVTEHTYTYGDGRSYKFSYDAQTDKGKVEVTAVEGSGTTPHQTIYDNFSNG